MYTTIKRKRVYIIAAIVSMSLAVALLFYMSHQGATTPSLKIADNFGTYDDLIDHSPIVVTATVISENEEFEYAEMTFALTEVEIVNLVRGNVDADTLQIMQTRSEEDPYLKKGTQVLLFLSEYDGPIAQNVYVINGLYNGQYVIKDDALFTVKTGNLEAPIMTSTDLESVILDVKNAKYTEVTQQAPSIDQIEKENELEKELESQENEKISEPND